MKTKAWYLLVLLTLMTAQRLHAAQNSSLVETKVKTLVVDPNSQAPVVVLETVTDKKLLPIWIAGPEARAIAIALENIKIPRPLTHDLIGNILHELDAKLRRVVIGELRNDTYIAFLSVESKGKELQIDSRPSDAIAIALRVKAPIFVSAQVLAKAKAMPDPTGPRRADAGALRHPSTGPDTGTGESSRKWPTKRRGRRRCNTGRHGDESRHPARRHHHQSQRAERDLG